MIKYNVKKCLEISSVHAFCNNYNYYNLGTVDEYDEMFKKVSAWDGSDDKLIEIAEDIYNHSVIIDSCTFEMAEMSVADIATKLAARVNTVYTEMEDEL